MARGGHPLRPGCQRCLKTPFAKEPLKYRLTGEDAVIYSIGDDFTGEGGTEPDIARIPPPLTPQFEKDTLPTPAK